MLSQIFIILINIFIQIVPNKQMTARRRTSGANQAMFKLIMVGDSGTGKSSLLVRYIKDEFTEEYNVTIGVQFASKKLDIDENYKLKLQIWDTAGQESFRSIVKSFYRNSSAVILVYDITKKKTFENLKNWLQEAKENAPSTAIYVLMGTHLDLQDQRQVTKEDAQKFMKEEQVVMFFETSAKTSLNVGKAFDEVAKQLFMNQLEKRREIISPSKTGVVLNPIEEKKPENEKGCC